MAKILTEAESIPSLLLSLYTHFKVLTSSDPNLEEKFWLVHGVARDRPLSEGLPLVQAYLRSSTDIMMWDSHSFNRARSNVHFTWFSYSLQSLMLISGLGR